MAGQRQKHPDKLAFKRGGRADVASPTVPVEMRADMRAPDDLMMPESRAIFEEVMKYASERLLPTDYFGVRRWISWVDRWLQEWVHLQEEDSVVDGALGTPVLNPRLRAIKMIEQNIVHAEQAMGLDPRARMRLGITFAEEQRALDGLKASRERRKPSVA